MLYAAARLRVSGTQGFVRGFAPAATALRLSCHAIVSFSSQSFADKAEPAQQSAAEAAPAVGTPDIEVIDAKAELTVFKVRL